MRKIAKGLLMGLLIMLMNPVVQAGTVGLTTECIRVNTGDIFSDPFNAPKIRIELNDAYKEEGKSIKFKLTLQDAVWHEREYTHLSARDLEGITGLDYTITVEDELNAVVEIDVPKNLSKEEQIAMTIPLLVRIDGNEPICTVKEKSNTKLIPESKLLFAVGSGKKAVWKISQPQSYDVEESIIMAPITFTEVKTGYISGDGLSVQISLEDKHYQFGLMDYISVQENEADIDYVLPAEKYLEFSGGFYGISKDLKIKRYKNDPYTLYVNIRGDVPSEPGSITLKNIPIKMVSENRGVEDINVSLKGDELVGKQENITVAYMIWREGEKSPSKEDSAKNEEKNNLQEENTLKKEVRFTIGNNVYQIDGASFKMEAVPYIEDGYTMIPVRYAALAFGAQEAEIKNYGKEVEFIVQGKQVILKKNSNEAIVDGQVVKMEMMAKVRFGRIYVPVGEISKLLDVEKKWDGVTKTAYFELKI